MVTVVNESITDWDRGCLAFYYGVNNQAWGGSGTDSSGNVTKAEMYVPTADGSYNMLQDQYSYDSLNRLQSVSELQWGTQAVFTQAYTYDRRGNRQINQAASSTNINTQQFGINTANNQLGVPTGQSGQMLYDASGNLTTDTYSRADPTRTYDGENRLITNTDTSNQVSRYTYEAAGRRVRRNANNQETWQVYGISGELIAEYAANASPTSVQKEYGYRGGELLVTATSTADIQWLVNDHLGTPRMIADKTGMLSAVKRHDYLPFGEEIFAGTGGRTAQQGYAADSVRQKFTKYERDSETNLDFAEARYFSSTQGRFTSVDPFAGSMRAGDPQSFNRYSYVGNNPVNRVDPSGKDWQNDARQQGVSQYYLNGLYELDSVLGASPIGKYLGTFDEFPDPAQEEKRYIGGSPNPDAQLGPCPDLDVATFAELKDKNKAALQLLENTHCDKAEAEYNKMSTYEKAVFLNTVAGAVSVGVDLSQAKFVDFYRSTKPVGASEKGGLPFGIYVIFASNKLSGRHGDIASVHLDTKQGRTRIDIDLYKGGFPRVLTGKHQSEVDFNSKWRRPTHPGDVARQLIARGVDSGVRCAACK